MYIPKTPWRDVLRTHFTQWPALADYLELSVDQRRDIIELRRFPLLLPRRLAAKMAKGTLDDPLLRQFLPTVRELQETPGFSCDAIGDQPSQKTPKLLKKYAHRVLMLPTSACTMHCRFCFRQHFPYETQTSSFEAELEWIRKDPSIHEVILSGGDPLSLGDATLGALLRELDAIPHLKRLRFHTRFAVGVPERLDSGFHALLDGLRLPINFILHTNHARELDEEVLAALKALRSRGVQLLSQSVLLRGVNDDADTLVELCETLVDHGIMPYYLHQLDRTQGTAHFEVTEAEGLALIAAIAARLPGYAVPKYVREVAGQPNKTMCPSA